MISCSKIVIQEDVQPQNEHKSPSLQCGSAAYLFMQTVAYLFF